MRPHPWQDQGWRLAAATICGFAAVFVSVVLLTRLSAPSQPLAAWWTMATALVVGGLCAASLDLVARELFLARPGRVIGALAASGVTSLGILATTRQGSPTQLAFACVLCALFSWTSIAWASRSEMEIAAAGSAPPTGDRDADSPLPDHVDQTLRRYMSDGRDHLEACVRVRFQAGQQTTIVHLPIQPPMSLEPEVECEPLADDDLLITVDPAQSYGIRLICRRGGSIAEAAESVVAVLATADCLANAAA